MLKYLKYAPLAVAAALLTACGGGGGNDNPAAATPTEPTQPTTPVEVPPATSWPFYPAPIAPVQSVPAATYPAGSPEASAFEVINTERSRCGFGKVAQSKQLDVAAASHSEYVKARWMENVFDSYHGEDKRLSGFTGATPTDRAMAAGYSSAADENIGFFAAGTTLDYGNSITRALLGTVYHLAGMMASNRDIGLGVAFAPNPNNPVAILVHNFGTPVNVATQEPAGVLTYPCEGSAGVQPYMFGEFPDPFVSLGFTADENVGQPIYVRAPLGTVIQLLSASVTSSTGHSVPVTFFHASQDAHKMLAPNEAFVVPREGLAQAATYSVQVQGTADGVPFARSFSFSTLKW